jgi:HlyD family secretion protein
MKMADLTSVQVRTRVDETDIGKIRPGMFTKVTVAAYPNQPFDGEVLKVEPQAIVEQNVTMFAVLIKIANRGGLLKPGMNADVQIQIANREGVPAVPTAALRADTDVSLTAVMLGVDEVQLRKEIWPDGTPEGAAAAGAKFSLGGRDITLPAGVDPAKLTALMEKRRSGQELSAEERTLMRTVFQAAGGGGGGPPGGFPGGGFPGGGPPPGGFPGGGGGGFFIAGGNGGNAAARPAAVSTDYLFGGNYWVVALRDGVTVPVAVKTGLTDLEYSEVVSGLEPGDKVLLLPSSSLFEQQERLQDFINQRFGASTPFSQQQNRGGDMRWIFR